jgi:NADH-quinone oxidoreductase subunit N
LNSTDFMSLAPLLSLSGGSLLLMLQIAIRRRPALTRLLSVAIFAISALLCLWAATGPTQQVTPLLLADPMALLLCAVFSVTAAATAVLSGATIQNESDQPDEYYLLLILATLGASVLVYAVHVASLLLGLELLSVSLYALVAYPSTQQRPVEAATKYLVLSGAATAMLLFGFALLYAATGSLSFEGLGAGLAASELGSGVLLLGGGLILVGLGIKLSAAPLHLWTPDVYEGAPTPVTGFLASVAKVAPFIVLLRLFIEADLFRFPALVEVTALFAALSMVVGNLLALLQDNIKRMLAYSSIAHMGYVLIIFSPAADPALRALAGEAALYYLIAYIPTVVAAFAVLAQLHPRSDPSVGLSVDSLSGLFWRQPLLATLMLFAMLSMAGIPLTAGFIGKLYIYSVAVAGEHWVLLALLIVGTALGIYYYLRVIYCMTRSDSGGDEVAPLSLSMRAVTVALLAGILALGLVPQTLMQYLSTIF